MIRIGISGWIYPSWRGVFYPKGLPQRRELDYASRAFASIEVNGTFYALKPPGSFRRWRAETPPDFVFALKGGRFITHMKRLRDVETALANFFASGVLALGPKLGPILWQLPENFAFDAERIARFLALLPRDTRMAARLGARHNDRVKRTGVWLKIEAERPLRHAIEVRHESFRTPEFVALLRRSGVALVVSDAPDWPRFEDVTADFVYVRLHGDRRLYESGYDGRTLDAWAQRIGCWAAGGQPAGARLIGPPMTTRRPRDVYAYFDNDAKIKAPGDAQALARRLGLAREGEPRERLWSLLPAK
jgi:uncharacterized protein YecE (DUF72 family)